jgi:hypothetical protein
MPSRYNAEDSAICVIQPTAEATQLTRADQERLDTAIFNLSTTSAAAVLLLIEKGVFTEAEWEACRLRMVAELDQRVAAVANRPPTEADPRPAQP